MISTQTPHQSSSASSLSLSMSVINLTILKAYYIVVLMFYSEGALPARKGNSFLTWSNVTDIKYTSTCNPLESKQSSWSFAATAIVDASDVHRFGVLNITAQSGNKTKQNLCEFELSSCTSISPTSAPQSTCKCTKSLDQTFYKFAFDVEVVSLEEHSLNDIGIQIVNKETGASFPMDIGKLKEILHPLDVTCTANNIPVIFISKNIRGIYTPVVGRDGVAVIKCCVANLLTPNKVKIFLEGNDTDAKVVSRTSAFDFCLETTQTLTFEKTSSKACRSGSTTICQAAQVQYSGCDRPPVTKIFTIGPKEQTQEESSLFENLIDLIIYQFTGTPNGLLTILAMALLTGLIIYISRRKRNNQQLNEF